MLTDQRTHPPYVPLPDQDADADEVPPTATSCCSDTRRLALAASWLSQSLVLLVAVEFIAIQISGLLEFAPAYLWIALLGISPVIGILLAGTSLSSKWPGDAQGRTAVRVMAVACGVLDLVPLLVLDAIVISAVRECQAQASPPDCTSWIILPAIVSNILLSAHMALSALVAYNLQLRVAVQEQGPEQEELAQRSRAHTWCSGRRVLLASWLTVSLVLLGGLVAAIRVMWGWVVAHGRGTPSAVALQVFLFISPLAVSVLSSIVLASAALMWDKRSGSTYTAQTFHWRLAVACAVLSGLQMLLADGFFSAGALVACAGGGRDCWKPDAAAAAVSTIALLAHIILSCLQARSYLSSRAM